MGATARVSIAGARTKIAKKLSQIAGVSSSMPGYRASASGRIALMPMPALLMSASILANRVSAASIACAQPLSVDRSATIPQSRSPAPPAAACSRSSPDASRSTAAMLCPSCSNARVMTRPRPPAAPVRSTTRFGGIRPRSGIVPVSLSCALRFAWFASGQRARRAPWLREQHCRA
jgi:hypothetical protein